MLPGRWRWRRKTLKLKVGNQDLRVDEMQHQIAMDIGEDLQFMLADSYEQINSESTSQPANIFAGWTKPKALSSI